MDLGLSLIDPTERLPHCFYVSVTMLEPQENGLPSENENEILLAMEKNLVYHLTIKHDVIYAGRMTADGIIDFYFYTSDPMFIDSAVSTSMIQYPHYKYDFDIGMDKGWDLYFNLLCPDERKMQSILSRHVVELMKAHGDDLKEPRDIFHWIYFRSSEGREVFIKEVCKLKFKVEDLDDVSDYGDGEFNFFLWISHFDCVGDEQFELDILWLRNLADALGGVYDGWEACMDVDDTTHIDFSDEEWKNPNEVFRDVSSGTS